VRVEVERGRDLLVPDESRHIVDGNPI